MTCYTLQITHYCPKGETHVVEMIKKLKEFGVGISGFDPLLGREEVEAFGIDAAEDIKGMGAEGGVMAVDDTRMDETAVLVAVEGKRLNADNVLNSYTISCTGERI